MNNKFDVITMYPQLQVGLDAIQCEMGVSLDDIRSKTQLNEVVMARVILCALFPSAKIRVLSLLINHHNSTVSYYRKLFGEMMQFDPLFKGLYERVFNRYNKLSNVE